MSRRSPLLSAFLAVLLLLALASAVEADDLWTLELEVHAGYRSDRLDWQLAGAASGWDGQPVNILSELSWHAIEIEQAGIGGKLSRAHQAGVFFTYLRGRVDYGRITGGRSRDSDYAGNNRTREYSRSLHTPGGDQAFDAALGLGLQWRSGQERFAVAVLAGYSHHELNLRLRNGVQTISRPDLVPLYPAKPPPPGPIIGLDSTYKTRWRGPWAGIDLEIHPSQRFSLLAGVEYHRARYRALADWNLRGDLAHPVSFRHDADNADGIVLRLGATCRLTSRWALTTDLTYQQWQAGPGTDRIFFAGGGANTFSRLNEVNWSSTAANAGLSYRF